MTSDLERHRVAFNQRVNSFIERYAPRSYEDRGDFEVELRVIIQDAFEEAQRPFVTELNLYRENTLEAARLRTAADNDAHRP